MILLRAPADLVESHKEVVVLDTNSPGARNYVRQLQRIGIRVWEINGGATDQQLQEFRISSLKEMQSGARTSKVPKIDAVILLPLLASGSSSLKSFGENDMRTLVARAHEVSRKWQAKQIIVPLNFNLLFSSIGERAIALREIAIQAGHTKAGTTWSFPVFAGLSRSLQPAISAVNDVMRIWTFGLNFTFIMASAPILSVVYLILWFIARFRRGGAVAFKQKRLGQENRDFLLRKLRTMKDGTGDMPSHEVHDGQITPLGHILRKTKLDEFPQIVNILRGEMNLIGYRPCLPSQSEIAADRLEYGVTQFKPGLTGLAQAAGVNMASPESLVALDVLYCILRNPILDCRILHLTGMAGMNPTKARLQALAHQQVSLTS